MLNFKWAFSSVVERCIHIAKIAGSIPATPTNGINPASLDVESNCGKTLRSS